MRNYIKPAAEVFETLPECYCSDLLSGGNYAGNANEITDEDYE